MTDDKIKLMFEKCTLDKANDKKLPSDSFIVSYEQDKELKHDIIRAAAQVDVFDAYYDKYKNVKEIKWTKGIISPRTYEGLVQSPAPKKKAGLGFVKREDEKELKVRVPVSEVNKIMKEYKKIKKKEKSNFSHIKKLGLVDKHGRPLK